MRTRIVNTCYMQGTICMRGQVMQYLTQYAETNAISKRYATVKEIYALVLRAVTWKVGLNEKN